jgi:hypothetical protein
MQITPNQYSDYIYENTIKNVVTTVFNKAIQHKPKRNVSSQYKASSIENSKIEKGSPIFTEIQKKISVSKIKTL